MKFSCKREDLLSAVSIAERAVASKSSMAILEGLYIEAKENEIRFLGNNLELCIDCQIAGTVQEKGSCVVKANLFSDAVKKLPYSAEDVFIEVNENKVIFISCGNAKFNFSTASADEFPRPQDIMANDEFMISEAVLKNMIRQTVYAIAQNDTKPYLTGILFDIKNNVINVVGCDGYRLAIRREDIIHETALKFIMQGKTARELLSILGDTDYIVSVKVSDKQAQLSLKNCTITTRLIDGDYLNYEGVAKHENTLFIVTDTKEILDSVECKNEKLERLINMGRFISNSLTTGINTKQMYRLKNKLRASESREESRKIADEMEMLIKAEVKNAEDTIPLVELDSRLGWEPSMEYMTDKEHIEWKIKFEKYILDFELPRIKQVIEIDKP